MLRLGIVVALSLIPSATPTHLHTQDHAARTATALGYLADHADREEKMMIPMRDGVRLSAPILLPRGRPRQDLPTILFRSPHLIDPGEVNRFAVYLQSFIDNGYAAVIENVRGHNFSKGYVHVSRGLRPRRL